MNTALWTVPVSVTVGFNISCSIENGDVDDVVETAKMVQEAMNMDGVDVSSERDHADIVTMTFPNLETAQPLIEKYNKQVETIALDEDEMNQEAIDQFKDAFGKGELAKYFAIDEDWTAVNKTMLGVHGNDGESDYENDEA